MKDRTLRADMRIDHATVLIFSLLTFSGAAHAQDCSQLRLGDRIQVSHEVPPGGRSIHTTTGVLFQYASDTLRLAESGSSPQAAVPMSGVTRMRVACGRNWVRPVLISVGAGALMGAGAASPQYTGGGAVLGALIGTSIGLVISSFRTRWIDNPLPPQPGVLEPDQLVSPGGRSGLARTVAGGALVTAGLGLLAFDPSLANDGTPFALAGVGVALAAWGLYSMLREER